MEIVYWLTKSAVAAVLVTLTVPAPVSVPRPLIMSEAPGVKTAAVLTVNVPPEATEKLP